MREKKKRKIINMSDVGYALTEKILFKTAVVGCPPRYKWNSGEAGAKH